MYTAYSVYFTFFEGMIDMAHDLDAYGLISHMADTCHLSDNAHDPSLC